MTRNPILTMNDESENQLKNIVRSFRSQVQIESFGGNIREFFSKGGKSVRIFFFFFWIVRRKIDPPFLRIIVPLFSQSTSDDEVSKSISSDRFFFFFLNFYSGYIKAKGSIEKYGNARNTRELSLLLLLRFRFEQSQVWSREKRYIFI